MALDILITTDPHGSPHGAGARRQEDEMTRTHRIGYHVWIYGLRYWHRTLRGAERRMRDARWADGHTQIIEVSTGDMLAGWRE